MINTGSVKDRQYDYFVASLLLSNQKSWIADIPSWWSYVAIISGFTLLFSEINSLFLPSLLPGFTTVALVLSLYICILGAPRPFTNIDNISQILAIMQSNNIPLANIGTHEEQFEFIGRLSNSIERIEPDKATSWARKHPDGYLVSRISESDYTDKKINSIFSQLYRFKHKLVLISSKNILMMNDLP